VKTAIDFPAKHPLKRNKLRRIYQKLVPGSIHDPSRPPVCDGMASECAIKIFS